MPEVNVDVPESIQNKEAVVDIVKAVLRGIDDVGFHCNGFNLHYKNKEHTELSYVQFHSLMRKSS
jgi:hypothetical protein